MRVLLVAALLSLAGWVAGPAGAAAPDLPAGTGLAPGPLEAASGCAPSTAGVLRCLAMVYYCSYVLVAQEDGLTRCVMALR